MGIDITMHIIKNKEILHENIFEGRNYTWFDNISRQSGRSDSEYRYFPSYYGKKFQEQIPYNILKDIESDTYYGDNIVKVKDFIEWYKKYQPNLHAGWVTRYEAWLYEEKGIAPEDSYQRLPQDEPIRDMVFIEYEDIYDCSRWLYNFIIGEKVPKDAYIIYYFDC